MWTLAAPGYAKDELPTNIKNKITYLELGPSLPEIKLVEKCGKFRFLLVSSSCSSSSPVV